LSSRAVGVVVQGAAVEAVLVDSVLARGYL
jgi:hypothetical protein